jgi:peptide-methionine (S)-S-oxide reductase
MRASHHSEVSMRRPFSYLRNRHDLLIALLAALALLFVLAYPRLSGASEAPKLETAVFAGGCFWGVEGVFEHVRGVIDVRSGYSGGRVPNPSYEQVSSGDTGHAESVEVVFDPARVSYGQLLSVFFSVAHDPTQLNRQGPDVGTQYRSAIFYATPAQQRAAQAYIEKLQAHLGDTPVVTQVVPLQKFYPAEHYHQDFMRLNPMHPYIVFHDRPKVARLQEAFPKLFVAEGLAAR